MVILSHVRFKALLLTLYISCFEAIPQEPSVEIVLARCQEDISWLDDFGYSTITTVYDKCGVSDGPGRHIATDNVGREAGAYLKHIVDRFDSLADWTVFSQAEEPSHGYRGHRLGGGHLLSGVRFQDYVAAAATRTERPLFFVFSALLEPSGDTFHQCFRKGYGQDLELLDRRDEVTMCGDVQDWVQWSMPPEWFPGTMAQLQRDQQAPFVGLDFEAAKQLFDVSTGDGPIFFAQGARFAASREAITARPKAYYQKLLALVSHPDPWAGYFLEWLWWYVLQGGTAPCGYEAAVGAARRAQVAKGRLAVTEALSGTPAGFTFTGNTTMDLPFSYVLGANDVGLFGAGSVTTFLGAFNLSGTGTAICETGATIIFHAEATYGVPATFRSCNLLLKVGVPLGFSRVTEVYTSSITYEQDATMDFTGTDLNFYGVEFPATSATAPALTVGASSVVRFLPGYPNTISAKLRVTGSGTLEAAADASISITDNVLVGLTATFTNALLAVHPGVLLTFTGNAYFTRGTMQLTSTSTVRYLSTEAIFSNYQVTGRGLFRFSLAAAAKRRQGQKVMQATSSALEVDMQSPTSTAHRRLVLNAARRTNLDNYYVHEYCGTAQTGALALGSTDAVEFQLTCQVTGTKYSNTLTALSYTAGSVVATTVVTASSRPTYIQSLTAPSTLPLEVVSALGDREVTVTLIEYGNPGVCPSTISSVIENCAAGYKCATVGRTVSTTLCAIDLTQTADTGNNTGSNSALLWLALLALVPLLFCFILWAWRWKKRRGSSRRWLVGPQMD